MPIPTAFPQVNVVLNPPKGQTNETCGNLPIHTDGCRHISRWEFSPRELEEIQKTGCLWMTVYMRGSQPPVSLDVLAPLKPVPNPNGKTLELNGVRCPKCGQTNGIRRMSFIWTEETFDWKGQKLAGATQTTREFSECIKCGYQVTMMMEQEAREIAICRAVHHVTGIPRELNESMEAYQGRLSDHYGDGWPPILEKIVAALGNKKL